MKEMSKKLKVAVIFGGRSGEHEVSLESARSLLSVLSKDKYEQAINEFRVSLKQGIGRIQEQIRKMDFIFHLPPDHSFYSMKKKVKKYLHIAKIFQFVLPIFEIIVPLALGIYSFIMIICELINK